MIGEAVVNAQKHAAAHGIEVDVQRSNGDLRLRVHDDGQRRRQPGRTRAARAARPRRGGRRAGSRVTSGADGTTVEAVLPCGS